MEVMATRDDVTVRIDLELRAKARELDINLSRMLEDALRKEIERQETVAETLAEGSEKISLDLVDEDGLTYVGTFTGKLIGRADDAAVYLTEDERVILYDTRERNFEENPGNDLLAEWLGADPGVYAQVMRALGEEPEIEI